MCDESYILGRQGHSETKDLKRHTLLVLQAPAVSSFESKPNGKFIPSSPTVGNFRKTPLQVCPSPDNPCTKSWGLRTLGTVGDPTPSVSIPTPRTKSQGMSTEGTVGRLHSKCVHPDPPHQIPGDEHPGKCGKTPLQACASLTPCTKSQGLSPQEQANRTGSCRHLPQRSGTHPESISNIRMPSAHQSTARPWPLL